MVIAFLAGGDHISPFCLSPPNERNDMIESQFGRREFSPAVVANPPGQALLPPAGLAQDPGLLLFFPDFFGGCLDDKGFNHLDILFGTRKKSSVIPKIAGGDGEPYLRVSV